MPDPLHHAGAARADRERQWRLGSQARAVLGLSGQGRHRASRHGLVASRGDQLVQEQGWPGDRQLAVAAGRLPQHDRGFRRGGIYLHPRPCRCSRQGRPCKGWPSQGSCRMSMEALLNPRSIAIIGASDNPTRIGGVPLELLLRAGFSRVYPVNPKHATIQGKTAYRDIESVPEVVDLAILALSAEATLPQLQRCHVAGIPAAIVYAAGFAETNEAEGQALQDALLAFAEASGMKIAGPNCMGNANFTNQIFTTFGQSFQPGETAGSTALLTQSGNMCATVFRSAKRAGVAFSHVINTGNEA